MDKNKSVMVTDAAASDMFFQQMALIGEENVRLSFFKYSKTVRIDAVNQSNSGTIKISGADFLMRDIEIIGYDKNGHILGIGNIPRDRFVVMMTNTTTGDKYSNESIDVGHYAPTKMFGGTKITPLKFKNGAEIEFEIKHDPVSTNTQGYAQIEPPVEFQIILSGAKIYPN